MSAFYDKMKNTAVTLIDRFGQDVVFERTIDRVINPVTGEVTGGETQSLKTRGILKEYDIKDIDGTVIQANDRMILVDGTIKPNKNDIPKIGGERVGVIINISETNPAGTPLVYLVQVRI